MRKINFYTILITVGFIFICAHFLQFDTRAQEKEDVIDRDSWVADDQIYSFKEDYNFPNNVIVVFLNKSDKYPDSVFDMRELYYYFSTRSGFGDLPFHYVVTQDGSIYRANKLGDEAKIGIEGTQGAVLISYLLGEDKRFSISAIDPITDGILGVINKYAISPENVLFKKLEYSFGDRAKMENIRLVDCSEELAEDISLIKESLANKYAPTEISFQVEIAEVILPEEELAPGSSAEVKIKIKNIGDYNLYSDLSTNIFIARNNPLDERSSYYITDKWDSLSRVSLLKESERLVVGEEKVFTFEVYVPLYPPEKSEDFILVDGKGNVIAETEFKITLKIGATSGKIIEITETPTGYLNVRQTPGLGEVITKVSPGERFLVKDEQDGYYKIEVGGKEGWVVNTYVRVVSG
ncbi:SH3 domain-containing protein [Candidatus Dojkabacteria bacterium]|nr:SH3 domain-containing protein [Candidatus Dojkabacteria bacterium]